MVYGREFLFMLIFSLSSSLLQGKTVTSRKKTDIPTRTNVEKKGKKEHCLQRLPENKWLAGNEIAYIIYTDSDEVILVSWLDINRPTLDGRSKTAEEELFNRLMYYEATHLYKIIIADDVVQKDFSFIKSENGLTDEQLEQLFRESLFSLSDGIEQRKMAYANSALLGQFVAGRIVVTQDEIKQYYDELVQGSINNSPLSVFEKESFRVKRAFVSSDTLSDEQVDELVQEGLYIELLDWKVPYWIAADELADHKAFIKDMKENDIYAEKQENGHELFMLVKKKSAHTKTFEEMKKSISQLLTEKKQVEVLENYKKELFARYTIVQL